MVNSTLIHGSLKGGRASDTLIGGSSKDRLTGGPGPDVLMGMQGNDQLFARDGSSDTAIDCDGAATPSTADEAELDALPLDPDPVVTNCETTTRP